MGDLTEHFDSYEFDCPHCGENKILKSFVERLEKLHKILNARSIIVSSGYRCPEHSVAVGGYDNDAHVMGFGADIIAYKQDGNAYTSKTVAYYAEKLGFGGIGIIDDYYCHVDTRDENKYANNHWFGNELTGENYSTFQNMNIDEIQKTENDTKIYINGKAEYSGNSIKEIRIEVE